MNQHTELIFVYNADSDLLSETAYVVNDILNTDNNNCSLCKVTHGTFGMDKSWKEFVSALPITASFLHKDEFKSKFSKSDNVEFPAIFLTGDGDSLTSILTKEEIDGCNDQEELRKRLTNKLDKSDIV